MTPRGKTSRDWGAGRLAAKWLGVLAAGSIVGVCGCVKPLFSPDEPRSQFDRFDSVRDRHVQQYVMDEFGTRKPNLRARLLTRE